MAKQNSQGKPQGKPPLKGELRTMDKAFAEYDAWNKHPTNRLLKKIFVPLFLFGLFALMWSIPFPHLAFLGKYNGYINWASFLIGISVFYYYRLSPVLSYFVLFTFFGYSYLIAALQNIEKQNGVMLWQIAVVVLSASLVGIWIGSNVEENPAPPAKRIKFLLLSPAYWWHRILTKLSIKH